MNGDAYTLIDGHVNNSAAKVQQQHMRLEAACRVRQQWGSGEQQGRIMHASTFPICACNARNRRARVGLGQPENAEGLQLMCRHEKRGRTEGKNAPLRNA